VVPGVAPFAVDVQPHAPGVLVARVQGDLDYLVAPTLRRRLLERLGASVPVLVVDLSLVTLLSAAAIQVLLTLHEMAPEHGVEVRLVAANRAVLRPLQLTGVDAHLPLHATIDDATRPS
jgi:anti-sigma B factor antagonist